MHKRLACAIVFSLAAAAHAAPENYTIDPWHTYANWSLSHLGFSTQHGRFNTTSGKITLDMAAKSGSADISIDVASIDSGWPKRDNHLRGSDFFNVGKFSTITFKSSRFQFNGEQLAAVDGELTMLGVTKPVKLTVTQFRCAKHPMMNKPWCGAMASTSIKRSEFGLTAYVPGVGDEVNITLQVEAGKD